MSTNYSFKARALIKSLDVEPHLPKITEHLEHHGAVASVVDGATVLDFEFARAVIRAKDGDLILEAEGADRSLLLEAKLELAGHLCEFTGLERARIVWEGDDTTSLTPPNFRLLTVVASERITPHMQRIRFCGENLLRYCGMRNLHCKLLIPPVGEEPQWPQLDEQGVFRWPAGPGKPTPRKYTIRAVDVENGTLDIDLVVHEDGGPGSTWAVAAKPGDKIGMAGPGGRGAVDADWYLLAGDETALPAISRMLEAMPADKRGVALIEVADRAEEQDIGAPAGFEIIWLHRDGAAAGTTTLLGDAVSKVVLPQDAVQPFVWAGCEFVEFKAIRTHARKVWNLPVGRHLVTSYWRRGFSEDAKDKMAAASRLLLQGDA